MSRSKIQIHTDDICTSRFFWEGVNAKAQCPAYHGKHGGHGHINCGMRSGPVRLEGEWVCRHAHGIKNLVRTSE